MAQSAAALRAEQAHELLAAIEAIEQIHGQELLSASRPIAPDVTVTTIDELRAAYEREAMKGVGLFARSSRKQARATALVQAQEYHAWLVERAERARAGAQAELDEMWRRLLANDEGIVIGTLAEAFEDNDAAAAPVGVHDGAAAIVVLVPTVDVVPERVPTLTAAGNLSLKKMTKGERRAVQPARVRASRRYRARGVRRRARAPSMPARSTQKREQCLKPVDGAGWGVPSRWPCRYQARPASEALVGKARPCSR
jgi:hypothetical protein